MRLLKNHDGITLIELVISMGITAIILSMIALIISTAAKSFKSTNEDVNLQLEAQVTINQLSTLIMEASEIQTGSVDPSDPSDVRYLIRNSSGSISYAIYFKNGNHKLYLIPAADSVDPGSISSIDIVNKEDQYLMAEYVTKITIETGKKSTKVVLEFTLGDSTYTTSKKVTLRNAK